MAFYSDINQQDPRNDGFLFDIETIYQSLDNVLGTEKGERMFLPEFGTSLMQFLFAPLTPTNEARIMYEVASAISTWEPRVQIIRRESYVKSIPDSHEVELFLVIKIKGLGETKYVFQTNLSRNQQGQYYAI